MGEKKEDEKKQNKAKKDKRKTPCDGRRFDAADIDARPMSGLDMHNHAKELIRQQRAEKKRKRGAGAEDDEAPKKGVGSAVAQGKPAGEGIKALICPACNRPENRHRMKCPNYVTKEGTGPKKVKKMKSAKTDAADVADESESDAHKAQAEIPFAPAPVVKPVAASAPSAKALRECVPGVQGAFTPMVRFDPTRPTQVLAAPAITAEAKVVNSAPPTAAKAMEIPPTTWELKEIANPQRGVVVSAAKAANPEPVGAEDPKCVYVGGLPYFYTEDDIREFFKQVGKASNIDMLTFPDSGRFRGIAFVSFYSPNAAAAALRLNGEWIDECQIKVKARKEQAPKAANRLKSEVERCKEGKNTLTAYVGNLSFDVDEAAIKQTFAGCAVSNIRWGEDKTTGQFRGFGHVTFEDEESLHKAIAFNGSVFMKRQLRVSYAIERTSTKLAFSHEGRDGGDWSGRSGRGRPGDGGRGARGRSPGRGRSEAQCGRGRGGQVGRR